MTKNFLFSNVDTKKKISDVLVDIPEHSFTITNMYNWTCTKCGAKVNQMNQPISTSCPKGGSHEWSK